MGEPQGWDELPSPYEENDDHEETDDEAAARQQQERCDSCRQQAEQFGEEVDCAMCGINDDELSAIAPVAVAEAEEELKLEDDEIPF